MAENPVNLFRHNLIVNLFVALIRAKKIPATPLRRACVPKMPGPAYTHSRAPFRTATRTDDQDTQEHEHAHQRIDRFQAETFLASGKIARPKETGTSSPRQRLQTE